MNNRSHPLSLDAWGHSLLTASHKLDAGMRAVDATAGNGHDTLFLARCLGPRGRVWAFDVQEQALQNTAALLRLAEAEGQQLAPVELIHAGHEHLSEYIPTGIHAVFFNFGYLPGSNKDLATRSGTSLCALKQAQELLAEGGCIWMHCYTGHPGGKEEFEDLHEYTRALSYKTWQVLHTETLNKQLRAEHILLLQKR